MKKECEVYTGMTENQIEYYKDKWFRFGDEEIDRRVIGISSMCVLFCDGYGFMLNPTIEGIKYKNENGQWVDFTEGA